MFKFSFSPRPVLRFEKAGLSFKDILEAKLDNAILVTLSACDSGAVDKSLAWDELEGLPHVFLQAGAASVVSSIWSVNDRSTSILMQRFYTNLIIDEKPPAQALREAQLWLRDADRQSLCRFLENSVTAGVANAFETYSQLMLSGDANDRPYSHPVYWAPFFVTGG